MGDKGIKAVSTSIYINAPSWLEIPNGNTSYFELSKNATKENVDLFLFSLFIYNDIPLSDNSSSSISNMCYHFNTTNGVALGGGLMFFEGAKRILPSCCCGLEQWAEIVDNISHKKEVWLGHDPTPIVVYQEDSILVWSNDYREKAHIEPKSDLINIEFSRTDLEYCFAQLKTDIREFLEIPFSKRLNELDKINSDRLLSVVMKWLL